MSLQTSSIPELVSSVAGQLYKAYSIIPESPQGLKDLVRRIVPKIIASRPDNWLFLSEKLIELVSQKTEPNSLIIESEIGEISEKTTEEKTDSIARGELLMSLFDQNPQCLKDLSVNQVSLLALALFEKDPFLNHIEKFNIPSMGEEKRYNLATHLLEKAPIKLAYNIEKFNIPSMGEEKRYNLAVCFLGKYLELGLSGWVIDEFNIPLMGEEQRYNLAELLLKNSPGAIAYNIEKFNLDSKKTRVEYAKIIADKALRDLASNIEKFNLDQETLVEYAKIIVDKAPEAIAYNIEKFNLDQETLVEYAKIIVEKDPGALAENIDKFNIPLMEAGQRHNLAENLLKNDSRKLVDWVDRFNLNFDRDFMQKLALKFLCEVPDALTCIQNKFSLSVQLDALLNYFKSLDFVKELNIVIPRSFLKDERKVQLLVDLLRKIFELKDKRKDILSKVLLILFNNKPSTKDLCNRTQLLTAIIDLNESDKILSPKIINEEYLKEILLTRLSKTLDLGKASLTNMFQEVKDISKLFTYLSKIEQLDPNTQKPMLEAYKKIILSTLDGTFISIRKNSPHLRFLLEKNIPKELLDDWASFQTRDEVLLDKKSPVAVQTPNNERFQAFLRERLIHDRHIENLQEIFPSLYQFLNKELDLKDSFKNLKTRLRCEVPNSSKSSIITIEEKIFQAMSSARFNVNEIFNLIKNEGEDLKTLRVFINDMEEFSVSCSAQKTETKKLFFTISDSLEDLLNLGTDTGGCQNVNGDSYLNKCLLGYGDGKNNIFAIRDDTGRMVARSIVRLLWDENNKCPALFAELIYILNPNPKITEALTAKIIDAAKAFNQNSKDKYQISVKLAFSDRFDTAGLDQSQLHPSYRLSIRSYGSIAPFEYCDSSSSGVTDGSYTIFEGKFYALDPKGQ